MLQGLVTCIILADCHGEFLVLVIALRCIKGCLGTSLKVHGALGFDQTSLLGCGGRGAGGGSGGLQPGDIIAKGGQLPIWQIQI